MADQLRLGTFMRPLWAIEPGSVFVINPFENDDAGYLVLVNDEGQHSLWPQAIEVPRGWTVAFGPDRRRPCLDHVEASWVDLRPTSLVLAMAETEPAS